MQGRTAVFHALGDIVIPLEKRKITANIFTAPEIATIGFSEKDIEDGVADGIAYKLPPLAANPRAKMQGIRDGFVKILARKGSGTVIGAVIVAPAGLGADLPARDRRGAAPERRPGVARVRRVPIDHQQHHRRDPRDAPGLHRRLSPGSRRSGASLGRAPLLRHCGSGSGQLMVSS